MKLHYLISFFKSYKPAFFLSLCLLLEMSVSQPLLAQIQTFNPTNDMSSEGNIQGGDSFYLKSVEKNK